MSTIKQALKPIMNDIYQRQNRRQKLAHNLETYINQKLTNHHDITLSINHKNEITPMATDPLVDAFTVINQHINKQDMDKNDIQTLKTSQTIFLNNKIIPAYKAAQIKRSKRQIAGGFDVNEDIICEKDIESILLKDRYPDDVKTKIMEVQNTLPQLKKNLNYNGNVYISVDNFDKYDNPHNVSVHPITTQYVNVNDHYRQTVYDDNVSNMIDRDSIMDESDIKTVLKNHRNELMPLKNADNKYSYISLKWLNNKPMTAIFQNHKNPKADFKYNFQENKTNFDTLNLSNSLKELSNNDNQQL